MDHAVDNGRRRQRSSSGVGDRRAAGAGPGARLSSTSASCTTSSTSTASAPSATRTIADRGRRQARRSRERRRQGGQERGAGHRPRAARRLLREQRRPLHLDRGQHDAGPGHLHEPEHGHGLLVHRPGAARPSRTTPTASRIGGGTLTTYIDPDPTPAPDYYQYHYQIFRIGNKGDGGAGSGLRQDRRAQRRRRHHPGEGVARQEPARATPRTSSTTSTPATTTAQEGYEKMRDLAAEFPNISKAIKLPEKTSGLPAQGADDARLPARRPTSRSTPTTCRSAAPTDARRRPTPPKPVVLTSKAWGHEGGNDITAQLVDPDANNAPLQRRRSRATRSRSTWPPTPAARSPAPRRRSSPRSTPTRRPRRSSTASKYRTNAAAGVVVPSAVSPLSDLLRAPATVQRGPQDQYMLRIGKVRARLQGRRVPLLPGARQRDRAPPASAWRPPSASCATTGPIPRRRRSSTTSTSSSSR